jgi:hypothetical protein
VAEIVVSVEGNIGNIDIGEKLLTLSGSESMACNKSGSVNVGDPNTSATDAVLTDKPKKRGSQKGY